MVKDNPAVLSEKMGAECQWLQKKQWESDLDGNIPVLLYL